jgi:hypothetical protein
MFTVLQRHVSTHTSHLQARTILFYKVTVLILGSQTLTMRILLSHMFRITIHINLTTLFQLHASHNVRRKADVNGKLEIRER